jgi:hypothetical protein
VLYVNGVSVYSAANTTNWTNGATLRIGVSNNVNDYVNGYISGLRVANTSLYSAAFTPPTSPVTAVSGTQLLLSNTNGAIFDNAMMNDLETAGNAQISTSVKKYGTGSLAFDGTGDYLYIRPTPNLDFGSGNFTVEAWTYFNTTTNSNTVISQSTSAGEPIAFEIYLASSEYFIGRVVIGVTIYAITSSTITPASTWQHIAMVRNGSTLTLYLNGTSVGSTSIGTGSLTASTTNMFAIGRLGEYTGGYYMNGYIDDLRITKGYARYTANFTPPTVAFFNYGPN